MSYDSVVAADNPTHWWKMGDPPGSTSLADSGNSAAALTPSTAGVTLGQPGIPGSTSTAGRWVAGGSGVQSGATFSEPQWVTTEAWFKSTVAGTNGSGSGNPSASMLTWGTGGAMDFQFGLNGGAVQGYGFANSITSTGTYNDGAWHHVVLTRPASGPATLYVDGAAVATGTIPNSGFFSGWCVATAGSGGNGDFAGTLAHVAVYEGATLSPTQVHDHYTAGQTLAPALLALGPLTVTSTSTVTSPTVTGTVTVNIGPVTVTAADVVLTRVGHIAIAVGPVIVVSVGARIGPGGFAIPGWRGRWRLTLHARAFAPATLASTMIAELADARGRRLDQVWNTPASLTFTLDGRSDTAALVEELLHDVVAWRFDDQTGQELPVFRGPITQSEDQLTTENHTVTYICHDYAAMLTRRITTSTYTVTARDQDLIVGDLLGLASSASTSSGTSLSPASFLPLALLAVTPAGAVRGLSGQTRNRTYYGSQNVGTAVDDLAKIVNGFDWDVVPSAVDDHDSLRVFYPAQGVTRTDGIALQYGSTVAGLTRSVNSADYANYVRVLGNNQSTNPTPQLYSEAWGTDAHSITPVPVGLWMLGDDAADVTVQSALDDKAAGDLNLDALLVPHYTLTMAPGAYTWGNPNMGDTVPLIVQSGRLDVNTTVRVLGITYTIGDDGQEDIELVVSRPANELYKIFRQADRDVKALARR